MKEKNQHILDRTIEAWQPYSDRQLTEEDAREIIENISGFFETLARWEQKSRSTSNPVVDYEESDRNT